MSLNTTPRTFVAGEVETAAIFNTEVRDAFTGIQAAWVAYTPTWASTGTAVALGNGTITGRWLRVGKTMHACEMILTLGSTSTVGTGSYTFSLPTILLNGTNGLAAGTSGWNDVSATTTFSRIALRVTTTTVKAVDVTGVGAGSTVPMVPAVGDIISFSLTSLELA